MFHVYLRRGTKHVVDLRIRSVTSWTPSWVQTLKGRLSNPNTDTIIGRWTNYWVSVIRDYSDVGKDVVQQIRDKPWKGFALVSVLCPTLLAFKTNPDEINFRDVFLRHANEFTLVPPPIRNPKAVEHLEFVEKCYNEGIVKRFSFGLFSVIWFDDYNRTVGHYRANCSYLKPRLIDYPKRVLDVGFLNRWWLLEKKMVDCDVNPDEWTEQTSE